MTDEGAGSRLDICIESSCIYKPINIIMVAILPKCGEIVTAFCRYKWYQLIRDTTDEGDTMRMSSFGTFGTAALVAAMTAGSALAADLPAPVYKAAPMVAPVYSWTGFYFGANVGYSWGRESNDWFLFGFPAASERQNMNGVIGGFQSGYNWQINQWVLGYESDIQASGQRGETIYCVINCGVLNVDASHKLPWFGTARSRVGYLVTPTVLLYATGGVAYGRTTANYTLSVLGFPAAGESFKSTRAGWTAGAGVEAAVGGGWSLKAEYLYMDLGTNSMTVSTFGVPFFQLNNRVTDNIARVGVNYKFGGF
jgi:outer membrane immunogenic protein